MSWGGTWTTAGGTSIPETVGAESGGFRGQGSGCSTCGPSDPTSWAGVYAEAQADLASQTTPVPTDLFNLMGYETSHIRDPILLIHSWDAHLYYSQLVLNLDDPPFEWNPSWITSITVRAGIGTLLPPDSGDTYYLGWGIDPSTRLSFPPGPGAFPDPSLVWELPADGSVLDLSSDAAFLSTIYGVTGNVPFGFVSTLTPTDPGVGVTFDTRAGVPFLDVEITWVPGELYGWGILTGDSEGSAA